ncbi:MAG: beta-galactosidase [Eubacteriales bacterium]|nr:beta-galactosidase [Eubacteriales bacterium]
MTFTPRFPQFLHGGDYNPDQWLDRPDILDRDIEMMHKAHVNCVSIGIFSWALLEPEEGVYDFDWLDEVIDRLWKGGIHIILATPSGARPAWMAQKYPEVLRVESNFQRNHFGNRHNHCPSSPVYREKVQAIDTQLAIRYAGHPAVILWHLSNEYSGDCRCPLCQEKWRTWLKERYGTIDELNRRWWTSFWSMRYTDWSQVEPPSPVGQSSNTSMQVDWRRFSTQQCKAFILMEKAAVQAVNPDLKCTANLMERFWDYDYFSLAEAIDVVSWDAYPQWHGESDMARAAEFAMNHEMMRSFKDQPFLLMESTPSLVNWKRVNKLKRPGMHMLSSMQALAHGSQSVLYFQWRKGRGGAEMFHGAVVDHDGRDDTRVFQDVTAVGEALERLASLYDAPKRKPQVCILYDWSSWWAVEFAQAGQLGHMNYFDTVNMHYRALWQQGVSVDFRDMRPCTDLSGYDLVVAPLLFMIRDGFDAKLREYVKNGGHLLMTYFSGVVDDTDLAWLGGAPHGLTEVLGVRGTELDALHPQDVNALVLKDGRRFAIHELCEIPEDLGAETLGSYERDFYAGLPCLTRNAYGAGEAYYLAAKVEQAGLDAIYTDIVDALGIARALSDALPEGVVATERGGAIFLQNYSGQARQVSLAAEYTDLLTDTVVTGDFDMPVNGVMVLQPRE